MPSTGAKLGTNAIGPACDVLLTLSETSLSQAAVGSLELPVCRYWPLVSIRWESSETCRYELRLTSTYFEDRTWWLHVKVGGAEVYKDVMRAHSVAS